MTKILLSIIILLSPLALAAETTVSTDADGMVTQMKSILDQYAVRIKTLEVENNILREEMRKAGIKIPLSIYSGAILQTPATPTKTTTTTPLTTPTATGTLVKTGALMENIAIQYGTRYAGFISKIHTDWTGIQWAYKLPTTSYIGGYEFVKQGADNHAFVDIIYDARTATGNYYDAKILYEYNTGTYQRKLIGFFEFDRSTGYYTTKSGKNIFPGVTRTFVRDPSVGSAIVPTTITGVSGTTSTAVSTTTIPTYAEIEKAYTDKRYLSVISLSNTYLTANTPTYDLLRIRYRTYFIIGKYTESLAEIAKIEAMGQLASVACDAQVIATYSKNATLIAKYTTACKK